MSCNFDVQLNLQPFAQQLLKLQHDYLLNNQIAQDFQILTFSKTCIDILLKKFCKSKTL